MSKVAWEAVKVGLGTDVGVRSMGSKGLLSATGDGDAIRVSAVLAVSRVSANKSCCGVSKVH